MWRLILRRIDYLPRWVLVIVGLVIGSEVALGLVAGGPLLGTIGAVGVALVAAMLILTGEPAEIVRQSEIAAAPPKVFCCACAKPGAWLCSTCTDELRRKRAAREARINQGETS